MKNSNLKDAEKGSWEATETRDASLAFVSFFKALFDVYVKERGLEPGSPRFTDEA